MVDPKTKFNTEDYSNSSKSVNMNFCNIAKVIIGRQCKEPQIFIITDWEKQNLKCDIELLIPTLQYYYLQLSKNAFAL